MTSKTTYLLARVTNMRQRAKLLCLQQFRLSLTINLNVLSFPKNPLSKVESTVSESSSVWKPTLLTAIL